MENRQNKRTTRSAHHLWNAELGEDGRRRLRRSKAEDNMFNEQKKDARRTASKRAAADTVAAYFGIFGADLVDDPTLSDDIPVSVSRRFNAAARDEAPPRIHTWDELRRAFGDKNIQEARQAISDGMKVRMASKYLDVPFVVAAEILAKLEGTDKVALKLAVDAVKDGHHKAANAHGPTLGHKVAAIFAEFADEGSHRIAIDSRAKAILEGYYGPYGAELTKEIKKRVRADLAGAWLRKNGVDEVSARYWSQYLGAYGEQWVKIVPKKISPAKK